MTEVDMHLYSDDWHPITILTYVTHISVHQNVEFDQYKAVNVIPPSVSVYYSIHQHDQQKDLKLLRKHYR